MGWRSQRGEGEGPEWGRKAREEWGFRGIGLNSGGLGTRRIRRWKGRVGGLNPAVDERGRRAEGRLDWSRWRILAETVGNRQVVRSYWDRTMGGGNKEVELGTIAGREEGREGKFIGEGMEVGGVASREADGRGEGLASLEEEEAGKVNSPQRSE